MNQFQIKHILASLTLIIICQLLHAEAPTTLEFSTITSAEQLYDGMPVYLFTFTGDAIDSKDNPETARIGYINGTTFRFESAQTNRKTQIYLRKVSDGYALFDGTDLFLFFSNDKVNPTWFEAEDDDYTNEVIEEYEKTNIGIIFNIAFSDNNEMQLSPQFRPSATLFATSLDNTNYYLTIFDQECADDPDYSYTSHPIFLASDIATRLLSSIKVTIDINGDGKLDDIEIICEEGHEILYALRPYTETVKIGTYKADTPKTEYNWKPWTQENWEADYNQLSGKHILMVKTRQDGLESPIQEYEISGMDLTGHAEIITAHHTQVSYYTLQGIPVTEKNLQPGQLYIEQSHGKARIILR